MVGSPCEPTARTQNAVVSGIDLHDKDIVRLIGMPNPQGLGLRSAIVSNESKSRLRGLPELKTQLLNCLRSSKALTPNTADGRSAKDRRRVAVAIRDGSYEQRAIRCNVPGL
jgi:hypothetical protein